MTKEERTMKVLKLTLKKQWFDMILSGEKKEEYREVKPYWVKRLFKYPEIWGVLDNYCCECRHRKVLQFYESECKVDRQTKVNHACDNGGFEWLENYFSEYTHIEFTNGYGAKMPRILIECKGIDIKYGFQKWGAIMGTKYFTIKLGEIIEKHNIRQ